MSLFNFSRLFKNNKVYKGIGPEPDRTYKELLEHLKKMNGYAIADGLQDDYFQIRSNGTEYRLVWYGWKDDPDFTVLITAKDYEYLNLK